MCKKTKIFISLFLIFIFSTIFQVCFAKYIIEDTHIVAKLDIDRCKPNIELIDIISSNTSYPTYANKTHCITGHIKITEKNIIRNDLSKDTIKIQISKNLITPKFKNFSFVSENATEKIYKFSITNIEGDGPLVLIIPEGIIEDKSGLCNESKYFSTGIIIDNTPPIVSFLETTSLHGKSNAQITSNEKVVPINGWNIANNGMTLSKEFLNSIAYTIPITDFAQNSSEVLVNIQNATNILLQYRTYPADKKYTYTNGGKVLKSKTIFSNSIPKSEALFIKLSGSLSSPLQGKTYTYTNLKSGLNPASISEWITSIFKNTSNFSIVYQTHTKNDGWLKAFGTESKNSYQHNKPISAFRMNLVPKTEEQYLIDFWNRDIGTNPK